MHCESGGGTYSAKTFSMHLMSTSSVHPCQSIFLIVAWGLTLVAESAQTVAGGVKEGNGRAMGHYANPHSQLDLRQAALV